jgi:hypothetical protein
MELLTYESYITNSNIISARRQLLSSIFEQFEEMKESMNEANLIIESGIFDEAFDSELNEESILAKMKQKAQQAIQIAKEKGKQALTSSQEMILKLGGNIMNVIKLMISKLKEWIGSMFNAAKSVYAKAVQGKSDEIKKHLDSAGEKTKVLIVKEVKQLKVVASSLGTWLTSGFSSEAVKAAAEVAKSDDVKESFELTILLALNESVKSGEIDFTDLLEGDHGDDHGHEGGINVPYLTPIVHKLHNFPPFSSLHKVKEIIEKGAKKGLEKLSVWATELTGAPGPFEFVALAGLIGILGEIQFKGVAKHAILHAVPGLKTVASIISNVAMAMAFYAIIETLIDKEDKKDEKPA